MTRREDYHDDRTWEGFLRRSRDLPTPHVLIDLDILRRNYQDIVRNFPFSRIHYAVKANPAIPILEVLRDAGSSFDIASVHELDRVLALGVAPERVSYGNTIKKGRDIADAWRKGVRLFATDSQSDLENIARHAPDSKIYVRILMDGTESADWPLSRKFGCHPGKALLLLRTAKEFGLAPHGLSFHVGSQQRDIGQWGEAISQVRGLFEMAAAQGTPLRMINMGGGFPAKYRQKTSHLAEYAERIHGYLEEAFGPEGIPEIILEPGRSIVADAGVLASEIIMASRKNLSDPHRWVYIDAGKFNGLIETMDESIKFPIVAEHPERIDEPMEPVILAGPTCDSMDVMYEKSQYLLSPELGAGDRLYWLTAGAYTTSYASVEFNGFPPIQAHFFDGDAAACPTST